MTHQHDWKPDPSACSDVPVQICTVCDACLGPAGNVTLWRNADGEKIYYKDGEMIPMSTFETETT